jgi:hypothetical protein
MHRHDKALWFKMKSCCSAKHLLCGNPHTFRGRIEAYCPNRKISFAVSLTQMDSMSKNARFWIDGFLCGNEPPPPMDKEGDFLPPDEAAFKRWEKNISEFRRTGKWKREWPDSTAKMYVALYRANTH